MPPALIIPAVVASAVAGGSALIAGAAVTTAAVTAAFIGGSTLALGFVQSELTSDTPELKLPTIAPTFETEAQGRVQTVRQALTTRRFIYGEAAVSGPIIFIGTSEEDRFLHFVMPVCTHEVHSIPCVFINDEPVYFDEVDGTGTVIEGPYAGKVRIKVHLGADDQAADPDLVAEVDEWTNGHRGRGVAYVYMRLESDPEVFAAGIPNIICHVRGKQVYDYRTQETRWTANPIPNLIDYMITAKNRGGMGVRIEDIDIDNFNEMANVCDEIVLVNPRDVQVENINTGTNTLDLSQHLNLYQTGDRVRIISTGTYPSPLLPDTDYYIILRHPYKRPSVQLATTYQDALNFNEIDITSEGSGTISLSKNAEPRYTLGGTVELGKEIGTILTEMVGSFAGQIVYTGGRWFLSGGTYIAPEISLDESDLRESPRLQIKQSRRDRFNEVHGVYVSPTNFAQPTDYPPVKNDFYAGEDGEILIRDVDFPYTSRSVMAQRLAKITLERSRQEMVFEAGFKMTAFSVRVGDNIKLTKEDYGWTEKLFEVVDWSFVVDNQSGSPLFGVNLALKETAPEIYDWNLGLETTTDLAPNTNLPSPFAVLPPTGVGIESGSNILFLKADGTVMSRIRIYWTASQDPFAAYYHVEYKKTSDTEWIDGGIIHKNNTEAFIWDVDDGAQYDARVATINTVGVQSAYVSVTGHTVIGKTAPPADVLDFSVGQNGQTVIFTWAQVPDIDLAGYEIRGSTSSNLLWEQADPITKTTRGTQITTAVVPPGDWTFFIKAVDTSGNESVNATRYQRTVTTLTDAIYNQSEADLVFPGKRENLLVHCTKKLVLQDKYMAGADDDTLFDLYVQDPYDEGRYTTLIIDIGVVDTVRVWATTLGYIHHTDPDGILDFTTEVSAADIAAPMWDEDDQTEMWNADDQTPMWSWTNWQQFSIGFIEGRFFQFRVTTNNLSGHAVITDILPNIDVEPRSDGGTNVSVSIGGTTIQFQTIFHIIPAITVQIKGQNAKFSGVYNETTEQFDVEVYDKDGVSVAGTIDWTAQTL